MVESRSHDLTPNIRDFMDSAEHGVVLFTMGFIFNAKVDMKLVLAVRIYLYLTTFAIIFIHNGSSLQAVPHATIAGLMSVFSRLPQRVIMKLDSEHWTRAAPDNVMVVSWVS